MSWPTALMVYGILWWLVLFMILPIGVRTPDEEGVDVAEGHVASAPVRPRLWWKALATTIVSGIIFAIGYGVIASGWVDVRGYFDPTIR